eukprot:scaffold25496_cov130-Isochrysis_galbana.AAC.14
MADDDVFADSIMCVCVSPYTQGRCPRVRTGIFRLRHQQNYAGTDGWWHRSPIPHPHGRRWRLDARPCQAPIYLSDTQEQSGTSNPGRPARAVSHPTLNLNQLAQSA